MLVRLYRISDRVSSPCASPDALGLFLSTGSYWRANTKKHMLTDREIELIVSKLPKKLDRITCSGGEPFMHLFLKDICEHVSSRLIKPCVFTSGYCSREQLEEVKPYISKLIISMRGPNAEVDNKARGSEAFSKAFAALTYCAELKIPREIYFTVGKFNIDYFESMVELARDYNAELKVLNFIPFAAKDRRHALDEADIKWLYEKAIEQRVDIPTPLFAKLAGTDYMCGAGVARIYIQSDGTTTPCIYSRHSLGNILKDDLETILKRGEEWREGWLKTEDAEFMKKTTGCIGVAEAAGWESK